MNALFRNKNKFIFLLVFLGVFALAGSALALEVDWPNSPMGTQLNDDSQLVDFIKYLYEWGISLGGFVAFVALIIAGFQYLTSAGNAGKMADAMDRMRSAGLGLILLLASVLILNTINPQLTVLEMPQMIKPVELGNIEIAEIDGPKIDCKKVIMFMSNGGSKTVLPDSGCQSLSSPAVSMEIHGSCIVELYANSSCADKHFLAADRSLVNEYDAEGGVGIKNVPEKDFASLIKYTDESAWAIKVEQLKFE